MAMGIVSDDVFDSEMESLAKPIQKTIPIIQPINHGRGQGNVNVPNGIRRIIGETAISDGRGEALKLGEILGVSPSSVSAYTQGATSTSSYNEQPNKPTIQNAKERIAKTARNRLRSALLALTPGKIAEAKAVEISTIAKNMAGVVEKMEPPSKNGEGSQTTQFILYAPQFRKEEHFDVVYAKE